MPPKNSVVFTPEEKKELLELIGVEKCHYQKLKEECNSSGQPNELFYYFEEKENMWRLIAEKITLFEGKQ